MDMSAYDMSMDAVDMSIDPSADMDEDHLEDAGEDLDASPDMEEEPACEVVQSAALTTHDSAAGDWALSLPAGLSSYTALVISSPAPRQAAAVFDDPMREVAGFILSEDAPGSLDARLGAHIEALRLLGITERIYTDAPMTTHDGFERVAVRYELDLPSSATPGARDDILFGLSARSRADVSNLPAPSGPEHGRFVVWLTVVQRSDRFVTLVAVAPDLAGRVPEDVRVMASSITDTTALGRSGARPGDTCVPLTIEPTPPSADVCWVLDQSGATSADLARLKQFAQGIHALLLQTSLDFRLGVTNMAVTFGGALRRTVGWHTDVRTFTDEIQYYAIDCFRNFPGMCSSASEGVYTAYAGLGRMLDPATPQAERVRPTAEVVTIFMSGTPPDSSRGGVWPGSVDPSAVLAFLSANTRAFALASTHDEEDCGAPGGAYEQIALLTGGMSWASCHAPIDEALPAMLETVAGRASRLVVPGKPISSSIRVQLDDGRWVPRSRTDGFDYFPLTRSIAFFGSYRANPSAASTATVHLLESP